MDEQKQKRKQKRMIVVFGIVLLLFIGRMVMLQTGLIAKITDKTPDQLKAMLSKTEVTVMSGDQTAGGTLLDAYKNSTKEENFTAFVATSAQAAKEFTADSVVSTSQGDLISPEVVGISDNGLTAVIKGQIPEEAEAHFSRDALARENVGEQIYFYQADGSQDGVLAEGIYQGSHKSTTYGDGMMLVEGSIPDQMTGAGAYTIQGYFLGTVLGQENGNIVVLPSDKVEEHYGTLK